MKVDWSKIDFKLMLSINNVIIKIKKYYRSVKHSEYKHEINAILNESAGRKKLKAWR